MIFELDESNFWKWVKYVFHTHDTFLGVKYVKLVISEFLNEWNQFFTLIIIHFELKYEDEWNMFSQLSEIIFLKWVTSVFSYEWNHFFNIVKWVFLNECARRRPHVRLNELWQMAALSSALIKRMAKKFPSSILSKHMAMNLDGRGIWLGLLGG